MTKHKIVFPVYRDRDSTRNVVQNRKLTKKVDLVEGNNFPVVGGFTLQEPFWGTVNFPLFR